MPSTIQHSTDISIDLPYCVSTVHKLAIFPPNSTMQGETGLGCQLQQIRCRRDFESEACILDRDICDLTMWLLEKYPEPFLHLWIDRHYFRDKHLIARLTVDVSDERYEMLTTVAREAFFALGYQIIDTGETTYPYHCCDGNHSRHEVIQAFGRIETALHCWRQTQT